MLTITGRCLGWQTGEWEARREAGDETVWRLVEDEGGGGYGEKKRIQEAFTEEVVANRAGGEVGAREDFPNSGGDPVHA